MSGVAAIYMSAEFRVHEWDTGEGSTARAHPADPIKESPHVGAFTAACFRSAIAEQSDISCHFIR
ncbi:hypothetical protein [Nonomuraea zeae]|uniref:Uncharacterized protein n=1 Tax=Nonomuraea zeae TaxID=1642303 RepID=A0A5S4G7V7_9ACTN|nr:hypothetical protein [Nonomuraea zeae]TMR29095.1 hypothetical protein ETD85_33465 [Nonomuraea zeae]